MKNFGKIIVLLLTLSVTALSGVSQVIPARTASSPSLDSLVRMSRFTRYMYDGAGNRIQRQTNSSLSPVMVSPQPEMQELQDLYGSSPVSVPVEKVKIFDFGVLPDCQERSGVSVADLSDPRERAQVLFASSANSEIADIDTSLPVGKIPVTEDVTATGPDSAGGSCVQQPFRTGTCGLRMEHKRVVGSYRDREKPFLSRRDSSGDCWR